VKKTDNEIMARFADLNLLIEENSYQRCEGIRSAIKCKWMLYFLLYRWMWIF